MNVLLLAPHPFYQDRGTPIAVDLLVQALSVKGLNVDVLTYHEGADRSYDGPGLVRIVRIPPPPGCRNIRPGFSAKKLVADAAMHRMAMRLAAENTYDIVHAVEESVFMAMRIERRFGIPFVFDMDSSMPEQIVEKMPLARPILPLMRLFESRAIRRASAVTAVCDSLADVAVKSGARKVAILRDVPLQRDPPPGQAPAGFRAQLGLTGACALYIGNLEPYQGIDLLIHGFARMPGPAAAHLVIVGGIPAHIEQYRQLARELGVEARVHLTGPRPLSDMAALMADADLLVSPRTKGRNTPMKIYSYMASGKPVLATNLFTHTQVLDNETAVLVAPEPFAVAEGLARLVGDPALRSRLSQAAARAVEEKYSAHVYRQTVHELYDWLSAQRREAAEKAG